MLKKLILLHLLLVVYSFSSVFSKLAAGEGALTSRFILFYVGVLSALAIYAVGYQQVIKHMPLSLAFANKAVTIIWGLLWGALCFRENVTLGKLFGASIIVAGIVIYSLGCREEEHSE